MAEPLLSINKNEIWLQVLQTKQQPNAYAHFILWYFNVLPFILTLHCRQIYTDRNMWMWISGFTLFPPVRNTFPMSLSAHINMYIVPKEHSQNGSGH